MKSKNVDLKQKIFIAVILFSITIVLYKLIDIYSVADRLGIWVPPHYNEPIEPSHTKIGVTYVQYDLFKFLYEILVNTNLIIPVIILIGSTYTKMKEEKDSKLLVLIILDIIMIVILNHFNIKLLEYGKPTLVLLFIISILGYLLGNYNHKITIFEYTTIYYIEIVMFAYMLLSLCAYEYFLITLMWSIVFSSLVYVFSKKNKGKGIVWTIIFELIAIIFLTTIFYVLNKYIIHLDKITKYVGYNYSLSGFTILFIAIIVLVTLILMLRILIKSTFKICCEENRYLVLNKYYSKCSIILSIIITIAIIIVPFLTNEF